MEFKGGSFKIAEKSGCPIIPVTMVNMSDIFEDHLPYVKKTRVVIEFGTPIEMSTLDRDEKKHINTYVQNVIAETYKKNKEIYF
jgi:1-acyl-sn-glycerol-3-phosphate acyltransferase